MSMQFNGSVHADGWWDQMPDGHKRDVRLNPYASEYETPAERRERRSHTALWVVAAVIVVGAAGIGAAYQRDPAAVTAQYDAAVDGVHHFGEKITDFFDNGKPAVGVKVADVGRPQDEDRLAMTEAPAAGPATAPAAAATPTPEAAIAPTPAPTVTRPEVAHATTSKLAAPATQMTTPDATPVTPMNSAPITPQVVPPAVDPTSVVPPSNAASAPPQDAQSQSQSTSESSSEAPSDSGQ